LSEENEHDKPESFTNLAFSSCYTKLHLFDLKLISTCDIFTPKSYSFLKNLY